MEAQLTEPQQHFLSLVTLKFESKTSLFGENSEFILFSFVNRGFQIISFGLTYSVHECKYVLICCDRFFPATL